jgi:FixJ family two-component response regulator
MAARVCAFAWSRTDLGARHAWSDVLLTAVSDCLASWTPTVLFWGARGTLIYNDACVSWIGAELLGCSAAEVWPEAWDHIAPFLRADRAISESSIAQSIRLHATSPADLETCLPFRCTPILAHDGQTVAGVLCCSDTEGEGSTAQEHETPQAGLDIETAQPRSGEEPKSARPRVFVVDDDLLFRQSLARLLRRVGYDVREYSSATEFLAADRGDVPACIVLDVRMPDLSGLELQRKLLDEGSSIQVVFVSGYADVPMSVRAMKAGAVEFLTKPFEASVLIAAVDVALARADATRCAHTEMADLRHRFESLTTREREVLLLVTLGRLNKQIASELGISEITVKVHRHNLMAKMRAASLPELVRMCERLEVLKEGRAKLK